jgi:hypothetical protein
MGEVKQPRQAARETVEVLFIGERPNDHCGCPEELYIVGGVDLALHHEDGAVDCHMDWGDADAETSIPCTSMVEERELGLAWARQQVWA